MNEMHASVYIYIYTRIYTRMNIIKLPYVEFIQNIVFLLQVFDDFFPSYLNNIFVVFYSLFRIS